MSYNVYISALLFITAFCCLFISYLSWQKRENKVAFYMWISMLLSMFYAFGYAFELISININEIRIWLRVQYIALPFGTLSWFLMVLYFTNRERCLVRWFVYSLLLVPIITFIGHNTDQWHHWFYDDIVLNYGYGFFYINTVAGPLYYLHVAYSYLLFFAGMFLLFLSYRNAVGPSRKQHFYMIAGSVAPYLFAGIYLSGWMSIPIDITPFGLLVSGVFYLRAIYDINFLGLKPLASKQVFESMNDAVLIFDYEHRLTSYNPAASKLFANHVLELKINQPAHILLQDFPHIFRVLLKNKASEERIKLELGGSLRHFILSNSFVYDSKQDLLGKIVLLKEITKLANIEESLRVNSLQLEKLNAFKDRMFSVVAHDFHTPIAVMSNLIELLRLEINSGDGKPLLFVDEMEKQIRNTSVMIHDLMNWIRTQQQGIQLKTQPIMLAPIVNKNIDLLNVQSERKKIEVTSAITDNIFIFADQEMIDLVLRNLLSNAIKFTEPGGNIFISAYKDKKQYVIAVRDTGLGMQNPNLINQEIEKFTPTSGSSGEFGFGIGLKLCKEFIEINNGKLWYENNQDQGSTFYFTVPAANY